MKIIAVIILLSIVPHIFAQTVKFDVGMQEWPPYSYYKSTKDMGIMPEVFMRIMTKMNLTSEIVKLSEERAYKNMIEGNTDARPKAKEWVKLPDQFLWSDEVIPAEDVIILPIESKFVALENLEGKIIGTVRGYSYPIMSSFFDTKKMQRDDSRDTASMLNALNIKHSDAAITNREVFYWYKRNSPELVTNLYASEIVVGSVPYRFQFTKNIFWTEKIALINKILDEMKKNGEIEQIVQKHR